MNRLSCRFITLVLGLSATATIHAQTLFENQPTLLVSSTQPGRTSVPNDVDGDGLSELLIFSPSLSKLQIWSLQVSPDQKKLTKRILNTLAISPGYVVGATGDLDGDGKSDLIFTSNQRDLYLWKSSGSGSFVSTNLGTYPEGWVLLGAADMDGDGTDDLLWHNASSCEFAYWTFKGGKRIGSKVYAVDCAYRPVAIGFFNLSKRASIVWADASKLLHVWDSLVDGFNYSVIGDYGFNSNQNLYRIGGGNQGAGMTYWGAGQDNSSFSRTDLVRNFAIDGHQSSWSKGTFGNGGKSNTEFAGGFIVRAQGYDGSGLITYRLPDANSAQGRLEVCIPSSQEYDFISLESLQTCDYFDVDAGWFPLGYHTTSS